MEFGLLIILASITYAQERVTTSFTVAAQSGKIYSFKTDGSLSADRLFTLQSDLNRLSQLSLKEDRTEMHRKAFGSQDADYLEWFSKRVNYFTMDERRGNIYASFSKYGDGIFRKKNGAPFKSIYFSPVYFEIQSVLVRLSSLLHEAKHARNGHHTLCESSKSPFLEKELEGNKTACDRNERGSYFLEALFFSDIVRRASHEREFNVYTCVWEFLDRSSRVMKESAREKLYSDFMKVVKDNTYSYRLINDWIERAEHEANDLPEEGKPIFDPRILNFRKFIPDSSAESF